MLKPAQIYVGELRDKLFEIWYDMKYQYTVYSPGFNVEQIYDNNKNQHQFVSVDNKGNIIGYISYNTDNYAKECDAFLILSFYDNNITFAKDVYQAIENIFCVYNFNVIHFSCIADNPARRLYEKYINKYGGHQCGYFHGRACLMDKKIYDTIAYEIIKDDWLLHYKNIMRGKKGDSEKYANP